MADRQLLTGSTFTIVDAHCYTVAMWTRATLSTRRHGRIWKLSRARLYMLSYRGGGRHDQEECDTAYFGDRLEVQDGVIARQLLAEPAGADSPSAPGTASRTT